jgi:2-dehydropantoate 2-reductase
MSDEKATRYVIFGAGAIGGTVAALLVRKGVRVVCVARPAYAKALTRGITINDDGEEIVVKVDAVTAARALAPESRDVVIITTKSQATDGVIADLAEVYSRQQPIVCLQNGVRNEEIAARRFERVYAALVFLSAVQLDPLRIRLPRGRTIAIGCFPEGVDTLAQQVCTDLARASFEALPSAHVMTMKWAKFILNLNNATHAITGYWIEQGTADAEMRRLNYEVRMEGMRVLDAAGIAFEPPAGERSPIPVRELTEKLTQPPPASAPDLPEDRRTYASTWQDLQLGRKTSEADYLNGEIVRLGQQLGLATPYNSTLLEIIERMFAEGMKPGIYTPAELHALIRAGKATVSQY